MAEYKVRALSCHPDKQPENPKAGKLKLIKMNLLVNIVYS